jgi:hypothetical protein
MRHTEYGNQGAESAPLVGFQADGVPLLDREFVRTGTLIAFAPRDPSGAPLWSRRDDHGAIQDITHVRV